MKPVSQLFGVLTISTALALTACGGGGSSNKGGGTTTSAVNGAAVKGILKNADIALYAIEDNVEAAEPLAETKTDGTGKYSFTGLTYSGAVLIKARGNDDALMVCDVPAGCDNGEGDTAAFGDDVPFGTAQVLEAVTVVSGGAVAVNITPLTHLAAAKAKDTGVNEVSIALANSHVANLFGLTGSLTELAVVDVTDAGAVAGVDANAQKAALIAAALYAAALKEDKTLDELATAFVDADGQLINHANDDADGIVDLAEILAEANAILELPEYAEVTIEAATSIDTALAAAENAGNAPTTAEPSDTVVLANLEKAKAFVAQIRTLGTSFITEESANNFADELEAAEALLAADSETLFEVLGYVVDAIAEVEELRQDGEAVESPYYVEFDEVEVEVAFTGHDYTVTSVTGMGNIAVDIEASLSVSESCTGNGCDTEEEESGVNYNTNEKNSGSLALTGEISLPTLKLEIDKGTANVSVNGTSSWKWDEEETASGYEGSDRYDATFTGAVDLDLHVKMTQLNAEAAAKLDGQLKLKLTGLKEIEKDTSEWGADWNEGSYYDRSTDAEEVTFSVAEIDFNGKLETDNNSLAVVFAFDAKSNGYVQKGQGEWYSGCDTNYTNCDWNDTWETVSQETNSKFVEGNFSLVVTAALAGITQDSKIELTGSRSKLNQGNVGVKISYNPGKQLEISAPISRASVDAEITPPVVTITNQDGVVAEITKNNDGKVTGFIKVAGTQYATITEPNVIMVRYSNGVEEGAIETLY